MKIVLIGAGSLQFGYGMLGDIFSSSLLSGSEIALLDINESALKKVLRTAQETVDHHRLDFTITATTDRKKALQHADFIISSIEVGNRFQLWDEDWKIPLQYGIHQIYGENGGPGGIFHSLRIIPPILDIMKDVMEICPDAWVFNYSNPMTAIATAVYRAYPEARFVGMCHEIGWLSRWLPGMLNRKIEDLYFKAAGLNHFSCMIELKDRNTGEDLYPEVLRRAPEFFLHEPGYSDLFDVYRKTGSLDAAEKFDKENVAKKSRFTWADRRIVKLMLEKYGLLPITVDSHIGEYLGWAWDVADHRGILDFYDAYKIMLSEKTVSEIRLERSERATAIIEGIISNSGYEEEAVNVLNTGLIEDLPSWVVVEVPGIIDSRGVHGMKVEGISKGFLALLRSYTGVYDLTAEAVIRKKKSLVVQALLANPVVHQASGLEEMVDRMIDQQNRWLGYLT
jgi:alpha-galactosidase